MKRWIRWSFIASLLAAAEPPAVRGELVMERYASPPESVQHGDFAFQYPAELVVQQDFVYTDAKVGPTHVVVLRHRFSEAGDLRSIEINNLRSLKQRYTCADYEVCATVDGVVIGTNSKDPAFKPVFDAVTRTFKARR